MSNTVIEKRIQEKISELQVDSNSIIVLKGIPLALVDHSVDRIRLEDAVANKLGYFMSLFGKRQYLCYEELLTEF